MREAAARRNDEALHHNPNPNPNPLFYTARLIYATVQWGCARVVGLHNSLKWWSIYVKFLLVVELVAKEILTQNISTKSSFN